MKQKARKILSLIMSLLMVVGYFAPNIFNSNLVFAEEQDRQYMINKSDYAAQGDLSESGTITGTVLVDGNDNSVANIIHEQEIFEVYRGRNSEIIAQIKDDVSIIEANLLIKNQGELDWMIIPMSRISGDHKDGIYKGIISSDKLTSDVLSYKIQAKDYAGVIETTAGEYTLNVKLGITPGQYVQGFEKNTNGWTLNGAWQSGVPSVIGPSAYEGEKLVATTINNVYPNNSDSYLISPPIDLSDVSLETASLRFYEWYDIANKDLGYLLISNNYGSTWTELRPAITGFENWKEAMVNLNPYIGSTEPLFIAFRFKSDDSGQAAGWYIDDVRLIAEDYDEPASPTELNAKAAVQGIKLSWNHSIDADISHYNIYRSETLEGSYIKIGDTEKNRYIDSDLEMETTYYYSVSAVDYANNESDRTEVVSATSLNVVTLFSENFEENNGNFTTGLINGNSNPWQWGIPLSGPKAAYSGDKLWATHLLEPYPARTDAYIETPDIVIPEDKEATLMFNHWFDFEVYDKTLVDYGQVLISKNNGATWKNITPSPEKYGTRDRTWRNEEILLAGYSGETVRIRFLMSSDESVVYDGWYIDDVLIMAKDYVAPEPIDGEELFYDDGSAEDAAVFVPGYGFAVRFTPTQVGRVESLNIFLWDDTWPVPGGNRLGFTIYDKNLQSMGEPIYFDDLIRGDWNLIDLSSFNFITGEDFYISTMQDTSKDRTPGVGLDSNDNSIRHRSYINNNGRFRPLSEDLPGKTLIMRAVMNYTITSDDKNFADVDIDILNESNMELDEEIMESSIYEDEILAMAFSDVQPEDYFKREVYVDKIFVDSEDVEDMAEYKINRELDTVNNMDYKYISDEEIQNTSIVPMFIPTMDTIIRVKETGNSYEVNPTTGEFSFKIAPGKYTLVVSAYGYMYEEREVLVVADQDTEANFILVAKPKGNIQGTIKDRYTNIAIAHAKISILEDSKVIPVIADENGIFEINNVYIGTYNLKVEVYGFVLGRFEVTVEEDKTTVAELGLEKFVGYENEIIYDDGGSEEALALGLIGHGLAVRFTPAQYGKVKGANVYVWDNSWPVPGGNRIGFVIYSLDENNKPYQIGQPIIKNVSRGMWNYIDLSSYEFGTDKDFYISTIQTAIGSNSPGIGVDSDSPYGDRSFMNIEGDFRPIGIEEVEGGLMIRAIIDYPMDIPMITNLSELNYSNNNTIIVQGTTIAESKVNVYVNDEKVASVNTENKTFSIEISLPAEENSIKVSAEINNIETEHSAPIMVVKDQEAPVLLLVSPENNIKINTGVIHVIGNVKDNINLESLKINDKIITLSENGDFHERVILKPGVNILKVKAIDSAGNVTEEIRTITVDFATYGITNIIPNEDLTLTEGEVITVSFEAQTGGKGYFKLTLPNEIKTNNLGVSSEESPSPYGILMTENNGVYTGTWIVPEGMLAQDLIIEVTVINANGTIVSDIATSKVNIIGSLKNLPSDSVIINNEAFNINWLRKNADLQVKLLKWYNSKKDVYVKTPENTIVTVDGRNASIEELADYIKYYDAEGKVTYYKNSIK